MGIGPNFKELFEQATQLKSKLGEMQDEAKNTLIEASAGGGMVEVVFNGAGELKSIKIEDSLWGGDDPEMLQDLIVSAVNEGLRKTKESVRDKLSQFTGGIPFPGL